MSFTTPKKRAGSSKAPISLKNPPNAPTKRRRVRQMNLAAIPRLNLSAVDEPQPEPTQPEPEPEWCYLRDSGRIRVKFLNENPASVAVLTDMDYLNFLKEAYFPASQPRNWHEEAYCSLMREAIASRLHELQ